MPQLTNAAGAAHTSANLPITAAAVPVNDEPVEVTADLYLKHPYEQGDPEPGRRLTLAFTAGTVTTRSRILAVVGQPALAAASIDAAAAGGTIFNVPGKNVNSADEAVFVDAGGAETAAAAFNASELSGTFTTPVLAAGDYTLRLKVAGIAVDQPVTVTVA